MKTTLAIVVVMLLCASARADKVDASVQAKADVFFEKAQAHYQAGQYQAAIELFKDAYDLVHDPVYLFNLAQSYRKVLDCVQATVYYNQYLEQSPNAENKTKVVAWVRELSPCVEQRRKEQEAAKKGEEIEREKRAEDERRRAAAAAPKTRSVDRGKGLRVAGIVTGSVGGVALAVAVGFSVRGVSLKNQVANDCTVSCNWDTEKSLDAQGKHANTFAAVGYVVGGVAVLTGAGMYLLGRSRVRMETIAVVPTVGGAAATMSLRF